nr:MAG TPA: hypothetical protein [Microviridae sp.]
MKKDKFILDRLTLDVAYYAFVGWLVRNNYYSKFMANFSGNADSDSPREAVRSHLSLVLRSNSMTLRDAISAAFLYLYTPEGEDYWCSVERKWTAYLDKLSVEF